MDIFNNFIRLFSREPSSEALVKIVIPAEASAVKTGKYEGDIMALKEKYGDLTGQHITVELQNLLILCPRQRHRIEAYQGLKSTLQKDYNCFLTILSQKTKEKR